MYLDDQTALMVSEIQQLVGCVRGDADMGQMADGVRSISAAVGNIMLEAQNGGHGAQAARLGDARQRLLEAVRHGQDLAGSGVGQDDRDWRMWAQTLPPIAFELARETKELVQRIGNAAAAGSNGVDEFS